MQFQPHRKVTLPQKFDAINRMRIVKIQKVKTENFTVKTFSFIDKLCGKADPGQFVMVWIPGVDEIPISLSGIESGGNTSITIHGVGEASNTLNQKKEGDIIGIRGPFGNGFVPKKGNVMVVGGGTGIGPLMPLVKKLVKIANKVTVMCGVKNKENLLFFNTLKKICSGIKTEIIFTTEDGSFQHSGLITDQVKNQLKTQNFDLIYACGPELMMYKIFILSEQHKIPIQVSLERIMRCSIGLCGSCQLGKIRVCKDGPVLNSEQLRSIKEEFGKFRLDQTGKKIKQV
ncbi:dihydroorotate dehydrogenase electron transfer subunit [Candidatus Bathyarchaeota archaeon]|nr:dihydroorotate dehydrogenase electron transfer subunit [Candidatus Bathyarchaeota archaeon]